MSIDIEIIPLKAGSPSWGFLKSQILALTKNTEIAADFLQTVPNLVEVRNKQYVEDKALLLPTSYYYFNLSKSNTLSLSCESNAENYTVEEEYIEDFGKNLDITSKLKLSNKWKDIGYSYSVGSGGGRAKGELSLLVLLAIAIAKTVDGVIVVKDDSIFSLSVGIYSPDQFDLCKPK